MPALTTLPRPVAASVGLIARGVETAKHVPEELPTLPVRMFAFALTVAGRARSTYDDLANRGEEAVGRLRGVRVGDAAREAADAAGDAAREFVREAAGEVREFAGDLGESVRDASDEVMETAGEMREAVTGTVDRVRRRRGDDVAAADGDNPPGSTVGAGLVPPFTLPDEVAEQVADATPGATLDHNELPLADYDHMTLGSLRARLTKLDAVALVQLRDYERAHANRLPVLTMLENRIAKVTEQADPQ